MSVPVRVDIEDRVLTVRLARPEKKNALTPAMYAALADTLVKADGAADVRVLWLTGSGDAFCSGNDVANFVERGAGDAMSRVTGFTEALATLGKPLVAAVNGMAVGIGATMLLHCDLVHAARGARLRFPFVDLGVVPEAASSLLLPAIVGLRRAMDLFLLGDWIDAEAARDAGLVNQVFDDMALEDSSLAVARRLAAKPPAALRATKALVRAGLPSLIEQMRRESDVFHERLRSPEAQEAFAAFLEKRKPDFSRFS